MYFPVAASERFLKGAMFSDNDQGDPIYMYINMQLIQFVCLVSLYSNYVSYIQDAS